MANLNSQTLTVPRHTAAEMPVLHFPKPSWLHSSADDAQEHSSANCIVDERSGSGSMSAWAYSSDLFVTQARIRVKQAVSLYIPGTDYVKFAFNVSGGSTLVFDRVGQLDMAEPMSSIVLQPGGVEKAEWLHPGAERRFLVVSCSRSFLVDQCGLEADRLSCPLLNSYIRGGNQEPRVEFAPLTPEMWAVVASMSSPPFSGNLYRMFMYAKATELICMLLQQLDEAAKYDSHTTPVNRRDRDLLHHAAEILTLEYITPPSVAAICRRLGTNRNKLSYGFKELFGVSMFEFIQHNKLVAANKLMMDQGMSAKEAAERVGYSDGACLLRAMRRHQGTFARR